MIFYILCIILLPYTRLCFDIIIYYDLFYLN